MELNCVELALKEIYDGWQFGNECENNGYSAMFRMGFPNEYISSDRPLLMYVGQEDLDGGSYKTQEWVRTYQTVQREKKPNEKFQIKTNKSAFWNFYRRLTESGYNVLWNNLDKFLSEMPGEKQTHLSLSDAVRLNSPYGEERKSVLQRESTLLKPNVIIFIIGPDEKYVASLASAFSLSEEELSKFKPTHNSLVNDISHLLGVEGMTALWTYHPNHLRISKNYRKALNEIKQLIDIKQ